MDSVAAQIAADSGALLHVSGELTSAERFRELVFTFTNGILIVRCDDDTDEIILEARANQAAPDPTGESLLDELLGMRIEHAWEMRNHRGYTDALQLRFIDQARREDCRQFEVAASAIDMRRVI